MKLRFILFGFLLCCFARPAFADFKDWAERRLHAAPEEMISKLSAADQIESGSEAYLDFVKTQLTTYEEKMHIESCGDFSVSSRLQFFAVAPNGRFFEPPAQQLTINVPVWFEEWNVQACGKKGIRSLLILRPANGPMKAIEMVPGETHTDPALQIDTMRIGAGTFTKKGCETHVIDSRIADDSSFMNHSWTEEWIVQKCGHTGKVQIQYSSGAKGNEEGTTIQVKDPDYGAK